MFLFGMQMIAHQFLVRILAEGCRFFKHKYYCIRNIESITFLSSVPKQNQIHIGMLIKTMNFISYFIRSKVNSYNHRMLRIMRLYNQVCHYVWKLKTVLCFSIVSKASFENKRLRDKFEVKAF